MRRSVIALALAAATLPAAKAQPAQLGRYDAQLCVATHPGTTPSCGTAEVDLVSGGRLSVRVADISYLLVLHGAQLDVVTMHGRMQIDEFSAAYAWAGETLRFGDAEKSVLYEVRIGAKRPARR